jgi:hypothetical protein
MLWPLKLSGSLKELCGSVDRTLSQMPSGVPHIEEKGDPTYHQASSPSGEQMLRTKWLTAIFHESFQSTILPSSNSKRPSRHGFVVRFKSAHPESLPNHLGEWGIWWAGY